MPINVLRQASLFPRTISGADLSFYGLKMELLPEMISVDMGRMGNDNIKVMHYAKA